MAFGGSHMSPGSPSIVVITSPGSGSCAERSIPAPPTHQPLSPDSPQVNDPFTVAGGRVVVAVVSVHPVEGGEHDSGGLGLGCVAVMKHPELILQLYGHPHRPALNQGSVALAEGQLLEGV